MIRRRHTLAAAALCIHVTVLARVSEQAATIEVPFTDEAQRDEKLVAARRDAVAYIEKRDGAGLAGLAVAGSTLQAGLRGRARIGEFSDKFWLETLKALRHGGTFVESAESRAFCGPYAYTRFPQSAILPQNLSTDLRDRKILPALLLGDKVRLLKDRRDDAAELAVMKRSVVKLYDDPETNDGWLDVGIPNGVRGWVRSSEVWWFDGQYACFLNVEGDWRLAQLGRVH